MALNAASHNTGMRPQATTKHYSSPNKRLLSAGVKTGPISGQPPPTSSETTSALLAAAKDDPMGQHEGGQDGGDKDAEKKVKSEKDRTDPS